MPKHQHLHRVGAIARTVRIMAEAAGARRFRFRFELRPLAQVHPWGRDRRTLHWFGLADGWYWIGLNGYGLPRCSDRTVRRWQADGCEGLGGCPDPAIQIH